MATNKLSIDRQIKSSGVDGFVHANSSGTISVKKSNLTAGAAPTGGDNFASGYSLGSMWIYGTAIYQCTGDGVWQQLNTVYVGGSGTSGKIAKWTASDTLGDSIMSEASSQISVAGKLDTSSTAAFGGHFINCCEYGGGGTPTYGYKIKTNIPFVTGGNMPTIIIEGYVYDSSYRRSIGLIINWYTYGSPTVSFYGYRASSFGGFVPTITLGEEGGYCVIHLYPPAYYVRFTVRAYANGIGTPTMTQYSGWTVVDEDTSAMSSTVVCDYLSDDGVILTATNATYKSDTVLGSGSYARVQSTSAIAGHRYENSTTNAAVYLNTSTLWTAIAGTTITATTANTFSIYGAAGSVPVCNLYAGGFQRAYFSYNDTTSVAAIDSDGSLQLDTNNTARLYIDSTGGILPYGHSNRTGTYSLGYRAGLNVNSQYSTYYGCDAGFCASSVSTTGRDTFIGAYAGSVNGSTYSGAYNTFIGAYAGGGNTLTSGTHNTALGYQTGIAATTGSGNTFLGAFTGAAITSGSNNVLAGFSAGYSLTTGSNSVLAGYQAGLSLLGSGNTAFGYQALYGAISASGTYNFGCGSQAGFNISSGSYNIFLGYLSGYYVTSGGQNVGIGYYALNGNTTSKLTGSANVAIGTSAGHEMSSGFNNVLIGINSGYNLTTGIGIVAVGANAGYSLTSNGAATFVGTSAGYYSTGTGCTFIGHTAGNGASGTSTASYNIGIGYQALYAFTSGGYNTALGSSTLTSLTTGQQNVALGYGAGLGSNGSFSVYAGLASGSGNNGAYNTFVGHMTAYQSGTAATGSGNTFIGSEVAGNSTLTSAGSNVAVGRQSQYSLTSGAANASIGYQSLFSTNSGSNNTVLGPQAGYGVTTGSGNVLIGYRAGYSLTTQSNLLYIDSGSTSSTPLVYGEFDNDLIEFNAWQRVPDKTSHPTIASGECYTYRKGAYYVIAYNDGGTSKYRYLDLSSTNATWSYSTTAP